VGRQNAVVSDLPSGTVTFLLTDIEGSTRLWEHQPEVMRRALARHDALLAEGIARHEGVLVKSRGEGDSIFAVFARATDAVAAACAVQGALHREPWPDGAALRIRMALHTGEAELREGDYYGPTVNRSARLRAVAHGGQTLLSAGTQELARDQLPVGVALRDLGEVRLRDLVRPERVFQLVVPGLPVEFPPLRSLDARPHNLPIQPTPLIGRDAELPALRDLLGQAGVRLLTLTGPGGTGKTRLSLQLAAETIDRFADGVCFVALASISDPGLVPSTIAQALGVKEAGSEALLDTLKASLREKHLLLVLDNFEQIIAAAPVVSDLLASGPDLKFVVTSRVRLHLRAEREFPVPPLALPPLAAAGTDRALPVEALSQYAAVRLFIDRAAEIRPEFQVTNENAPAIAEICHRLDGLPLAIELAGARIKLLAPHAILARLQNRLKLLTGGARDLPARHQTLRDTIAWSYDLLTPDEQTLFRRLAVFVGGWTLEAAEAIATTDGRRPTTEGESQAHGPSVPSAAGRRSSVVDILDGIGSLVDKSLVRQGEGPEGEPRFRMLETIREYGLEQLEAAGEAEALRQRHAEYHLALAEAFEPTPWLIQGDPQPDRLEADYDNLRAALAWYRACADGGEALLRLAASLRWFWASRGYLGEGRLWLEAALTRTAQLGPTPLRARASAGLGRIAWAQADHGSARARLDEAVASARQHGDHDTVTESTTWLVMVLRDQGDLPSAHAIGRLGVETARAAGSAWGLAANLMQQGALAVHEGDLDGAARLIDECVVEWVRSGDAWGRSIGIFWQGVVALMRADYPTARARLEQALAMHRAQRDDFMQAQALNSLGDVARGEGDAQRAAALYGESLSLWRRMGNRGGIASLLHNLGYVAQAQSDHTLAAAHFRESAHLFRDVGDKRGFAEALAGLAGALGCTAGPDDPARLEQAAELFGASAALLAAMGAALSGSNRAGYERNVALLRDRLGAARLEAEWARGRVSSPDEAFAAAEQAISLDRPR
jgi:predicted ATPase/class 3 adenylate cyclase